MSLDGKIWPTSCVYSAEGYLLEMRAALAWKLIGERLADRHDRTPSEIVARAFEIADEFVSEATARGDLREQSEADLAAVYAIGGQLQRIKEQAMCGEESASDILAKLANYTRAKAANAPTEPTTEG